MNGQILAIGARGTSVSELQQMLVEAGFSIDDTEETGTLFGTSTDTAVRAYQLAHGLPADGVVGPKTRAAFEGVVAGGAGFTAKGWRWDSTAVRAALLPVVQFWIGEIGVVEVPPHSNRGLQIDSYWRHPPTGMPGPAWCAAFASAGYRRFDGGSPFGFISSTFDLADWGRTHNRVLLATDAIEGGDIGLILRDKVNRRGHTVPLVHDLGDARACTAEGNSGDAVRGLIRARSQFDVIVRPAP